MALNAGPALRRATLADIPQLLAIENLCFAGNRLGARNFRHMLRHAHGVTLVETCGGRLRGYVLLLFRSNSKLTRVYSIATHPEHAGRGVAARLLGAAEALVREHGYTGQRLEIREDNRASLSLFGAHGYRIFGRYPAYYHDGMDALRLEKTLSE